MPKHSLFGQSLGDIKSYKSHRDSAYDDVEEAKRKIGNLKQEHDGINNDIKRIKHRIGEIIDQINQTKTDCSKMYELKDAGHSRKELQSRLDELSLEIKKLRSEISTLISNICDYITSEKYRRGVMDLESKAKEIEQKRKQFIDSFELEEFKQERMRSHREAWIKQRGMV